MCTNHWYRHSYRGEPGKQRPALPAETQEAKCKVDGVERGTENVIQKLHWALNPLSAWLHVSDSFSDFEEYFGPFAWTFFHFIYISVFPVLLLFFFLCTVWHYVYYSWASPSPQILHYFPPNPPKICSLNLT